MSVGQIMNVAFSCLPHTSQFSTHSHIQVRSCMAYAVLQSLFLNFRIIRIYTLLLGVKMYENEKSVCPCRVFVASK